MRRVIVCARADKRTLTDGHGYDAIFAPPPPRYS